MDRQTAAIEGLTSAVTTAMEALRPAAEAISDLGAAQKRLCDFVIGNRLKILGSIPVVLTIIGGLSPNVAHVLAQVLKVWGVQ